MEQYKNIPRRTVIKSAAFGFLAVSVPNLGWAKLFDKDDIQPGDLHENYPAIDPKVVSEVVGVSHFDLDRLKEMVDVRPELAKATWDWGFGDWEDAVGAASHVGRLDIVQYLIEKGARPTLFTYAMLGELEAVKNMLSLSPDMKLVKGPHGISLREHAEIGFYAKSADQEKCQKLIDYLDTLDLPQEKYLEMTQEEKEKFLGDYKYGEGEKDGFSIKLNMRKLMALGKIGTFGGALYKTGDLEFVYNGTTSIKITFEEKDQQIISMTIKEPGLELKALKV